MYHVARRAINKRKSLDVRINKINIITGPFYKPVDQEVNYITGRITGTMQLRRQQVVIAASTKPPYDHHSRWRKTYNDYIISFVEK